VHPQPPNAPPQTNALAIAAVVSGALGWFALPWVASLAAIVCGHLARTQIRQTGEKGDELAIVGMILGYSHIAMTCLVVAFFVVIYGGIAAVLIAAGVMAE